MLPSNFLNGHLSSGGDSHASTTGNGSNTSFGGAGQASSLRNSQGSLPEGFGYGDGMEQSRQLVNLQNKAIIANALLQRAVREGVGGSTQLMNSEAERLLATNFFSGDLARQQQALMGSLPPQSNLAMSLHHRASNQADTISVLQQVMELEQRRRMDALLASNLLPTNSIQDSGLEAAMRASNRMSLLSARDSVGNPSTLALEAERQRLMMEQAFAQRHHPSSLFAAAPGIMDVGSSLHQSLPSSAAALQQSLRNDALLAGGLGPSGSRFGALGYSHLTHSPPAVRSPALGSRAVARDGSAAHRSDRSYHSDDSSEGRKKPAAKSAKKKAKPNELRASNDAPEHKYFPSERASLEIGDCSPADVSRVLKVLGSTLRCKADPFVDVDALPGPLVIEDKRVFRGTDVFFPDTLFKMLEDAERDGWDDVIHWMPHGRSIRVSQKDRFVRDILPRYFSDQTKWSSFSRQLRLYGFARVAKGVDLGKSQSVPRAGDPRFTNVRLTVSHPSANDSLDSYYHELFLKDRGELVRYMRRVGAPHGLDRRTFKLAEGEDPDFYQFPPLTQGSALKKKKSKEEKSPSVEEQEVKNVDATQSSNGACSGSRDENEGNDDSAKDA
jgi:HSF-type DNA-binding